MSHWTTTSGGAVQTEGIYSYYATGQTQDFWQCTPLECPTATYSSIPASYYIYDLAGDLTDYYSPLFFYHLTNSLNTAQQVTTITTNLSGAPNPLLQNATYAPTGG
jgi:hypothetical protein